MKQGARVLVTGASGFLGKTIVPLLEERGYVVETIGRGEAPCSHLKHYAADISVEVPTVAIEHADAIIHLAGDVRIAASIEQPAEHIEKNLSMTLHLLQACKAQNRSPLFIYISTDRVYGKSSGTVGEQSPVFPVEPYVAAKLMSETVVATYSHILAMPYVVLRTSAFFGPYQPRRGFIADVICKMLETDSITTGPLQGVKNFTYAGNVADAIVAALEADDAALNRMYNIGGSPRSLQEILDTIRPIAERITGRTIKTQIDHSIKIPDKHDIGPFTLSTRAAQDSLHWSERVALEEGLEKTINYFRHTLSQPNSK